MYCNKAEKQSNWTIHINMFSCMLWWPPISLWETVKTLSSTARSSSQE